MVRSTGRAYGCRCIRDKCETIRFSWAGNAHIAQKTGNYAHRAVMIGSSVDGIRDGSESFQPETLMKRMWRLLIIGAESNYGRQVVKGILAYCRFHDGWEFRLEGDTNLKGMRRSRQAIGQWKADGIIARVHSLQIERMIKDSGLPTVNISHVLNTDLPAVVADSVAIGKMAARYFLDNRFRNLAFCARTFEIYTQQRCDAFVWEAAKAGLKCGVFTDRSSKNDEPEWVSNRRKLDAWLLSLKKPVGVMCVSDLRAQEIAGACRAPGFAGAGRRSDRWNGERGISLFDVQSAPVERGFSDRKIGYEAAQLLDRMLHGPKPPPQPILVPPRGVVVRQSSDIIAIEDRETVAAVRFIRDHAYEPVTIKELLAEVPLCRRVLEQRFAKNLGRTPKAEIMRVRLLRAQNLLEDLNLPVKAVVKGSGFVSYRTFNSFFRRQMGMTPMQYRRSRSTPTGEGSSRNAETAHINSRDSTHNPGNDPPTPFREQRQRLDKLAASSGLYSRLEPPKMREIILAMCQKTFLTAANLGELLHRNPKGVTGALPEAND